MNAPYLGMFYRFLFKDQNYKTFLDGYSLDSHHGKRGPQFKSRARHSFSEDLMVIWDFNLTPALPRGNQIEIDRAKLKKTRVDGRACTRVRAQPK